MAKPVPPSGDFELRNVVYGQDCIYDKMTDIEMQEGRNNTGEVETPLGSVPNAQKDNWLFCYLNTHIKYLTDMVNYLDEKVGG